MLVSPATVEKAINRSFKNWAKDCHGVSLAMAPVEHGWPAKEIITAAYDHDQLSVLIPIDIAGNLTELNPNDLYW